MSDIASIYKALADESRLRLIRVLSLGWFNVQELTAILGVSQSTISHHLKILSSAQVTRLRREGTWAYYSLAHEDPSSLAHRSVKLFLELGAEQENGSGQALLKDTQAAQEALARRRELSRNFFNTVAEKWKDLRAEAQGSESFVELIKQRIPDKATLLELGCGSGALFEQILPRPGITIGVDYSQAMLEETRRTLGDKAKSVDLRLGYLEHLPLGDESVDCAVAYMVLHHLPTPNDALKDAQRALRPGGKLLIIDLLPHSNEYMRERFADLWLGLDPEDLKRAAFACGFAEARLEVLGQKKEVFLLTLTKTEG